MNRYPWHPHYAAAMLATNLNQRLITLAEKAINGRLQDSLRGEPISHCELQAIKYAEHQRRLLSVKSVGGWTIGAM